MKKIIAFLFVLFSMFGLASCEKEGEPIPTPDQTENDNNQTEEENNSSNENNNNNNDSNNSTEEDESNNNVVVPDKDATIFLAGDSTVKTYNDNQYIAGWGQYLELFLKDNITVKNCAQGGRSSRSFINEGRLYDIAGNNFTFNENNGNSIGSEIQAGDYLFIQFGHNDDDTKGYSTMVDRMVPLGEPDSNGIYPTTAPESKRATTYIPEEFSNQASSSEIDKALDTIAKYGSEYYAYGDGTYKWYLKQYIDFAREKGATPVLITPVARVKFSNGVIIGGDGLHGYDFAYVKAVRQLAEEEDCLLIDLFANTKELLEATTQTYSDFLMALKPNDLSGEWPSGYDAAYRNTSEGYEGIEATHYNKYGAFLTAGYLVETLYNSIQAKETHNDGKESYQFVNSVLTTPTSFIDPSNYMSISKVEEIEALIEAVNVTNPNRVYKDEKEVVAAIEALVAVDVTDDNYLERQTAAEAVRKLYNTVNVDYRGSVTNLDQLVAYEALIEQTIIDNRPVPTLTVKSNFSSLVTGSLTANQVVGEFTLFASSGKALDVVSCATSYTYNSTTYDVTRYIKTGGTATFGSGRYIGFTTTGACSVTVVVKSGSSTDPRFVKLVNANDTSTVLHTYDAGTSLTVSTAEVTEAGTYYIGSTSSSVLIYDIIIEYFD